MPATGTRTLADGWRLMGHSELAKVIETNSDREVGGQSETNQNEY